MNVGKFMLFLLLPIFLGSCAPKVLTHIEKKYPSRIAAVKSICMELGKPVPETASGSGVYKSWTVGHPPNVIMNK